MPTVILLDVSLSMSRPVLPQEGGEEYQRRHLAVHGINTLLDYMSSYNKLEFVSLVLFSSEYEQVVDFTRDYDQVKKALDKLESYNKTCLDKALEGASSLLTNEWGVNCPSQVVLITDGNVGIGASALSKSLSSASQDSKFPLPFGFPCKLHIVCVGSSTDALWEQTISIYQKLIDMGGHGGDLYAPESSLCLKGMDQMFTKLAERSFAPMHASLKCGHLRSNIQLSPPPDFYDKKHDFKWVRKQVAKELDVCGFLDISDVSSPPYLSRHLVLPVAQSSESATQKHEIKDEGEEEEEDSKQAAFTVLLHGSLKVEGMVAITQIAENWYGMLYSWADSKKKSNLMLSIFEPGEDVLAWLGNLNYLAPVGDFAEPPYGDDDSKSPFPVRPAEKRSYAHNSVSWIKSAAIQADIQKVLRHARKLPEKQPHFYKELNRVRKAALSLGFIELLESVATLLERECTQLPGNTHPDVAMQLSHAATSLKSEQLRDIHKNIQPLRTNFTGDS